MYSYTGNNPINYVDPTGHRFTANLTDTRTGGNSQSRGKDKNQEVIVPEPEEDSNDKPYDLNLQQYIDHEHIEDSFDLQKYVDHDEISKKIRLELGTFGLGVFGTAQAGIRGSVQYTLVADNYGNVGLLRTIGAGGGTPSFSGGVVVQTTNAKTIFDLEHVGNADGGSVAIPGVPVAIGVDAVFGDGYFGSEFSLPVDPTKLAIPAEIHGEVSESKIGAFYTSDDLLRWGEILSQVTYP